MHRRSIVLLTAAIAVTSAACSVTIDTRPPVTTTTTQATAATTTLPGGGASDEPQDGGAGTTGTTGAPEDSAHRFMLNPVDALSAGAYEWDEAFVSPGAIVVQDGTYHMLFTGSRRGRTPQGSVVVGYATSDNGVDFFRETEEPVLDGYGTDYVGNFLLPNRVLVDDGTWVMYFETRGHEGRPSSSVIGRATAPGPEGPWTLDPEPLLLPGERQAWDFQSIDNPWVVRTDDGWVMYYDGHTGDSDPRPTRMIGMATSPDGVTWEKWDDPATTEPPFHASDPVFRMDQSLDDPYAWDHFRVYEPKVFPTDDGWLMIYTSDRRYAGELDRTYEFGVATSVDGVTWERADGNPVWSTIGLDWTGAFLNTAVHHGERWAIYIGEARGFGNPGAVRVLEYEGTLP